MWHEARKQEKKIRGMMVDYRKRAERRRDFYEKFKADPTQFLQLHGRPCRVHLDPAVAAAGDSASVMMPWQGHSDILIDRFDVRAHLDVIADAPHAQDSQELSYEERTINYERYRILVQNEFLRVNEEKFLKQIYLEEQFGPIALKPPTDKELSEKEKRKKGAAIAYQYEDSTVHTHSTDHLAAAALPTTTSTSKTPHKTDKPDSAEHKSDSEDSDVDFDLCLDISQIDTPSAHEMNTVGQRYGLTGNDFYSLLTNDVEEQEAMRLARQQEEEKAMFSGRKARRERQAFREKKLIGRVMSPPSYAARKSPTYDKYKKSRSRSASPDNTGQITYITSFGGDGDDSNEGTRKGGSHRGPKKKQSSGGGYGGYSLATSLKQLISSRKARGKSKSPTRSRSRTRSKSRSTRTRSRTRSRTYSSSSSCTSRSRSKPSNSSRSRSRSMSSMTSSSGSSPQNKQLQPGPGVSVDGAVGAAGAPSVVPAVEAKPVLPRYYGRRGKSSSSELDVESDTDTAAVPPSNRRDVGDEEQERRTGDDVENSVGNARATSKLGSRERPQEKLKKKMQAMLNRQFRLDKKAEKERLEKAERERADREAELRDISLKMRRRERYLRHLNDEDREPGSSGSRSRSRSRTRSKSRSRSRSRSQSPKLLRPLGRTLVDY